ncbi:MAG: 4-hydroxythreonine-4-phosphate dehydrogenase PdxA [Bdellovibrionales bacterium]|jgi:4-hydroxythreonine-4-phosphate dehydrogenase|nr:4-hydroxythreonine-4-phosphate dehydrogenase PdxA [Bdellovibrionales bacterium]
MGRVLRTKHAGHSVRIPARIGITTGDIDGIGMEITRKALSILGPQKQARFMVACAGDASVTKELTRIRNFKKVIVTSREAPLHIAAQVFSDLRSDELLIWRDLDLISEAHWVQSCAKLALTKSLDAIVTGPASKRSFQKLGRDLMGHTGLLAKLAGRPIQQGYFGRGKNSESLALVLATDHIPLNAVEKALSTDVVQRALRNADALRALLPKTQSKKPICVLGLDPHAGEQGLIGSFDAKLRRLLSGKGILGPMPADSAFTPEQRAKVSVFVALYHDQGLIPFKMLHGQGSGFQISLGLPFIRTSVDHGTACDLFGKNKANPGSMKDAIQAAISLAQTN